MRLIYKLEVVGPRREIARILGEPTQDEGYWTLIVEEAAGDPPLGWVEHFLSLLEPQLASLEKIGVRPDDATIWLLYEYDGQCNLDFPARDLARLGSVGVDLCISCWEGSMTGA